jgi:hypothetical protein
MSNKEVPYSRIYQLGTCFLCQICLTCNELLSFKHCKCNLSEKVKNTKKRKNYSRVYNPNTKHGVYNDLQLSKLDEANKIYSYGLDFSQHFNYCLCSICHNVMVKLKKYQLTKLLTNSTKTSNRSNSSVKTSKEISSSSDGNDEEEIDKEEFEKYLVNEDFVAVG